MNTVNNKILIGITGVIASGKSLVLNYLKELGYFCLNADEINKKLLTMAIHIKHINKLLFSEDSLLLDKKRIKDIIFKDAHKKDILENYLHPLIHQALVDQIANANVKTIFVEMPLLFETNNQMFDKIITVYLSKTDTIKRLSKRDKITSLQAKRLVESQIDIDEKVKLSDYVIDNSKTMNETKKQVRILLKELEKTYGHL